MCDVCFYDAWVPVETAEECAFVHPHEMEHRRCDYCWLQDKYWLAQAEIKRLKKVIHDRQRYGLD